ncbi:MAG: hypothetical protein HY894_01870, partial [Deltaproteobacteria bacterium]|nr:hypothetical protein [Deltaproteobacteria bacterium]
ELVAAVEKLHIADVDLKTGRSPEPTVLPVLILELCGGGGGRQGGGHP